MGKNDDRRKWDARHNFSVPQVDTKSFPIAMPVAEDEMEWVSRRWTVCQILREIYHAVEDPRLKLKCRIASAMAKEMINEINRDDPHWGRYRWPWREKQG